MKIQRQEQPLIKIQSNEIFLKFNQTNSSYETQLKIRSNSNKKIYFKILTTFGKLLTFIPQKNILQVKQQIILKFKLRIPNQVYFIFHKFLPIIQISKKSQRFFIIYSIQHDCEQFLSLQNDLNIQIKFKFDENVPDQDQMIQAILEQDCKQLCQQAKQLIKKGMIKKALYKYQESFMLYRQDTKGIYGMAECFYLLQDWSKALQAIETALIIDKQKEYFQLRTKIIYQIFKDKSKTIKFIKNFKKLVIQTVKLQQVQDIKNQMIKYLDSQLDKLIQLQGGQLIYQLVSKTLDNFQNDEKLKQLYPDKNLLHKQLNQILGNKNNHIIQQAPQYILDPISYQIMIDPVIGPSGHSYQKKSLMDYLRKYQHKDLFTRKQLYIDWTRPNLALKKFIQQNPDLKKWIFYEKEITSFK